MREARAPYRSISQLPSPGPLPMEIQVLLSVPEIFPGQAKVGGDSKIPILYYDQQGNVCAVGGEANEEGIEQTVEDKEWAWAEWYVARSLLTVRRSDSPGIKVQTFKLHLRPRQSLQQMYSPTLCATCINVHRSTSKKPTQMASAYMGKPPTYQ
jgi:hypothetical protein